MGVLSYLNDAFKTHSYSIITAFIKGILKITLRGFISQLQTMKAIHSDTTKESLSAISKFRKLFADEAWET